ncbi:MAG: tetratricopeptide repeat protein [Desulfobaccales bacterium]
MRVTLGIRYLAVGLSVLFLASCSETYAYLPSVGKPAAAAPAEGNAPAAQPAPAVETPARKPDLPQQVQGLEVRVQQLETRMAELEARQPAPAGAAVKTRERPAAAAPATSGDKLYNDGLHLYQGKKYPQARAKFSQYLKEQPKGPKASEARYQLADSFLQEGKYQEAAVEFNKLASQSPKSILAPAAMLRQAMAYQHLQQTPSYRSTLRKLVQTYPKSPEAKEAQKWLQEGKQEAPPGKAPAKAAPKPE